MEIAVRRARPEDTDAVLRCLREAFEEYRDRYTAGAYLDTVPAAEHLRGRMDAMRVFVAERADGEIAGTIACALTGDGHGHLRGLAVRPAWQGNGIASRLLHAAEGEMRCLGCLRISLDTTRVLQGAIQFYEGRGYRSSGRVTDFFGMELIEYVKEMA